MRTLLPLVVLLAVTANASAQVQSRPTDAPLVTAEHEPWFIQGDPVQFAGNVYYRAGAAIFFDGNRMVRTGSFNGVPLYADTTVEPYSLVFVPIGRGLMQPYERPRSGDLAGTVGSRSPSFPVSALPTGWSAPMAPSAPTSLIPLLFDDRPVSSIQQARLTTASTSTPFDAAEPVRVRQPPLTPEAIQAVRERVWIEFDGQKWVPAGAAVPLQGSGLAQSGSYAGFPVYTRVDGTAANRIYVPSLPGLVAPYELKR